jgi:hypothetical protein
MRSGSDSTNDRTKPFQQVRVRVDFPAVGGRNRGRLTLQMALNRTFRLRAAQLLPMGP